MAGAFIEIKVDDRLVLDALGQALARLGNLKPAFEDIGEALLLSHHERWQRQVAPDGTPWQALSPPYQRRKQKNADKILVLDGYLQMLHPQTGPDFVAIGTDRKYGAVHQFGAKQGQFGATRRGSPIPWGDIPARPFLGLSESDQATVLEILAGYLAP